MRGEGDLSEACVGQWEGRDIVRGVCEEEGDCQRKCKSGGHNVILMRSWGGAKSRGRRVRMRRNIQSRGSQTGVRERNLGGTYVTGFSKYCSFEYMQTSL